MALLSSIGLAKPDHCIGALEQAVPPLIATIATIVIALENPNAL